MERVETGLHDALLDERGGVVDEHDERLWLDEFIHHLLQHEVRQKQQHSTQQLIEPTAHQHQAVLRAGPRHTHTHTRINIYLYMHKHR